MGASRQRGLAVRDDALLGAGSPMKIAFVGLGKMGKPMALNMLKVGADTIVSSATDESFEEFRQRGARATRDVADTSEADMIFLCLPNGDVVRNVVLGERGIAHRLR